MIKKLLLIASALVFSLGNMFSQNNTNPIPVNNISGTEAPPQQWDDWFNAKVEEFKKNHTAGKAAFASYNLPVIFHILHSGQSIGTTPNIAQATVNAQTNILNQVYKGQ